MRSAFAFRSAIATSLLVLIYLSAGSVACASILARWTFETSIPTTAGPHTAEGGINAATSSALGSHAAATTYSNPAGNGSVESFSSNNWSIGDYYQFQTSTVGFENIVLTWDQTRSSTGPSGFDLLYSVDGTNFVSFFSYVVPAVGWSALAADGTGTTSFSSDLSAIAALDNTVDVYFRLSATSAPSSAAGTNRVDNFTIGTAVPEASTFLVWSMLCGSVLVGWKRARDF